MSMTNEDKVAEAIALTWRIMLDGDLAVAADHCILGARLAIEAARYFGLPHPRALPTDIMVANEEAIELIDRGVPVAEWPPSAHSVGTSAPPAGKRKSETRYAGHLLATTDHHLFDLSAGQFNRPAKGIVLHAWAANKNQAKEENGRLMLFNGSVYVVICPIDDLSWRQTKDWQQNYRRFAGQLIRLSRKIVDATP